MQVVVKTKLAQSIKNQMFAINPSNSHESWDKFDAGRDWMNEDGGDMAMGLRNTRWFRALLCWLLSAEPTPMVCHKAKASRQLLRVGGVEVMGLGKRVDRAWCERVEPGAS